MALNKKNYQEKLKGAPMFFICIYPFKSDIKCFNV